MTRLSLLLALTLAACGVAAVDDPPAVTEADASFSSGTDASGSSASQPSEADASQASGIDASRPSEPDASRPSEPDASLPADPDAGCQPKTCAQLGAVCGSVQDGCGHALDCGGCLAPQTCGGAGVANQCGSPTDHAEETTLSGATGDEPQGLIPVCCAPSASEKAEIAEVFRLLNEHRRANGLPDLAYDDSLEAAIEGHCHHMAIHDFFDHYAPEPAVGDPWVRAQLCGSSANGENIAAGQGSAAAVMDAWKNSSGHNANMLSRSFTRVGIGLYVGGPYRLYWGQLFGQ
jgi:uncharacterized protein YkwD